MGETKIDMKSPLGEIDKAGNLAYGENDPLAPIYEGIKKNMDDLEARYAQPNWFKIAAGFAKPQLGGFIASLGSAAEAAGENFEQQRQLAIPLANMRTELAVKGQILARNKEVNDEIRAWQIAHPKEAVPSDKLQDWSGRAPDSTGVKSLLAERTNAQKNLELSNQQRQLSQAEQNQKLQLLTLQQGNLKEMARLGLYPPSEFTRQNSEIMAQINAIQSAVPNGPAIGDITTPPAIDSSKGSGAVSTTTDNSAALAENQRKVQALQKKIEKDGITPSDRAELNRLNKERLSLNGGAPVPAPTRTTSGNETEPEGGYLPETHVIPHPSPAISDLEKKKQELELQAAADRAKKDEDFYQSQAQDLKFFSSANGNYRDAERAWNTIYKAYKEDPLLLQQLNDAVREKGPMAAAMNEGFAFHAGSLNANVSLPVSAYAIAGLDDTKRTKYDNLASAYATLANAELARSGISPEKATIQQYKDALYKTLGIGSTAESSVQKSGNIFYNLKEKNELSDLIDKEYKRTKSSSISRYTDVFNSPRVKDHHKGYKLVHDDFNRAFEQGEK